MHCDIGRIRRVLPRLVLLTFESWNGLLDVARNLNFNNPSTPLPGALEVTLCVCVCVFIYIYICVCVCVCIYICVCVCVYIYIYIYIYIHSTIRTSRHIYHPNDLRIKSKLSFTKINMDESLSNEN